MNTSTSFVSSFLFIILVLYNTNITYSQTDSSTVYAGGGECPHPQNGFKEIYSNIQDEFPDSMADSFDKKLYLVFSLLINSSGRVDSVITMKSSNDTLIDNLIINGLMKTNFIYPDTLYGYPKQKWINIGISTQNIVRKKSFWEWLKF